MICLSVTPSSRTLAPADILNASRQCDLIELCLDRFIHTPDIGELLKVTEKPVLISCRRPKDGGEWRGTEDERMQLLRNAIVAGPAFVELELDIAASVPRFGETKRVISHTSLHRPITDVDAIFEECWKAKADVVKFTWPTENLDAAWPLLAAVTRSRELPVVGTGLGAAGLTFSLLGRKFDSPWIYAALERGMEAYDGQMPVHDLEEVYHWQDIGRKTRFLGVLGSGSGHPGTARIVNKAFAQMGTGIRCLPLVPGNPSRLKKMLAGMKINGLIADPTFDGDLTEVASPGDAVSEGSGYMDLLLERKDGWVGRASLFNAVDQLMNDEWPNFSAKGRSALLIGDTALTRATGVWLQQQEAAVTLTSPSDNAAANLSRELSFRHCPWAALHDIRADMVVLAQPSLPMGSARGELSPMCFRERLKVLDLTAYPEGSSFTEEAMARGAACLDPSRLYEIHLNEQFRTLTKSEIPSECFSA